MSYRFNSGKGGVTCDKCNILIDEGLGHKEYKLHYGKGKDGEDYCWRCKIEVKEDAPVARQDKATGF